MLKKAITFILLPILLTMVCVSITFHLAGRHSATKVANERLNASAQLVSELLHRNVDRLSHVLQTALHQEALNNYVMFTRAGLLDDAENARLEVEHSLIRFADSDEGMIRVEFFDASGDRFLAIVDGRRNLHPHNVSETGWFATAGEKNGGARFGTDGQICLYQAKFDSAGNLVVLAKLTWHFPLLVAEQTSFATRHLEDAAVLVFDEKNLLQFQSANLPPDIELVEGSALSNDPAGRIVVRQSSHKALLAYRRSATVLYSALGAITVLLLLQTSIGTYFHSRTLVRATRDLKNARSGLEKQNVLLASSNAELTQQQQEVLRARDEAEAAILDLRAEMHRRQKLEFERQKLNEQLVQVSRQAGMAEVATGVLHNVGNILNSVNVSTSLIRNRLSRSPLASLEKVSSLITEYQSTFADFIRDDDRGKRLPQFIVAVTNALRNEREKIDLEIDGLVKNVEHIKQIVSVQQSMAKSSGLHQELDVRELVEDVLTATRATLASHNVEVNLDFEGPDLVLNSDKHKILQILINLIGNAKDALVEHKTVHPNITILATDEQENIVIRVIDNGIGISDDKIDRIFQHGFTTKKTGHGFGLHSSANAAVELGGSLIVLSDGSGCGATFELHLPKARVSCPAG